MYQSWLRLLKLLRLKKSEPMPLTAGVLIIGSLFWDSEQGRPAWREARLDMVSAQSVTAPIRYGRLSGKGRGHTYTTVFSRLAGIGHGKAVRCSRPIATPADLLAEAEALWKAEQPGANAGRIADYWGCVAVLCNPERKLPEDLLKAWTDRIRAEPNSGNVTQTKAEGRLIDENGRLLIAWPTCVDRGVPLRFDLLLVTANDPEISTARPDYPDVATIVGAWNGATAKHAEYFWKNAENAIHTFQDDEIRPLLRPRGQEQP